MLKPKIGITIGDINGIGPEIVIKTFSQEAILKMCTPIIYANSKVLVYYKNLLQVDFQFSNISSTDQAQPGRINVIQAWKDEYPIEMGQVTKTGGMCAYLSLDACVQDIKANKLDAMVTGPIHKKSMHLADFPYPGHTEYLANASDAEALMLLCSDELRVALVTGHLPLKEVVKKITKEQITKCIHRFERTLKVDFGIEKPMIAVLGLNPHAGDDGVLGEEEDTIIRPAVLEAKKSGKMVFGPFPADGFFGSGMYKKYHGTLAMYHDQGLVGFKSLSFGNGVNFSSGLNFVRTSPDHGTGFDIAGKNVASIDSFRNAIYYAIDIVRNHKQYYEDRANPLKPSKKRGERS